MEPWWAGPHDSDRHAQSQTASAAFPGPAFVKPDEPLKDALPVRFGYRVAVVVHGNDGISTPSLGFRQIWIGEQVCRSAFLQNISKDPVPPCARPRCPGPASGLL